MALDRRRSRPALVVTWCTAKKRTTETPLRLNAHGSTDDVAAAWLGLLSSATPTTKAADLYQGRAFKLACSAAKELGADLAVVSAGLGWVRGNALVPGYDLTFADGAIATHVSDLFKPAQWWRRVVNGPFSTDPHADLSERSRVLACVSREYAPLFEIALSDVPPERLRIFGAGLQRILSPSLALSLLPYDERLDTVLGGTRSDFAQRALMHYVRNIAQGQTIDEDRAAVVAHMDVLAYPATVPRRTQLDDNAIRELIVEILPTFGRRRSPMLRHLRDVRGVACEQSRFARLFADVVAP